MAPLRDLTLAVQFMTRLPTPPVRDFREDDVGRSAPWFPFVGLVVGVTIAVPAHLLEDRPQLAAIVVVAVWTWITGALHLDGLGDVADALGASHRDPSRYAEVLKDPHVGSFGVVTLIIQLMAKFALVSELCQHDITWVLVLVPPWARWCGIAVMRLTPSLQPGLGERFAGHVTLAHVGAWLVALAVASVWVAPTLLVAPLLVVLASVYWRRAIGGVSGDGLGATIELSETALLIALVATTF